MPTPNFFKYNTDFANDTLRHNNVQLGINDVVYGPTETTGYWNGITPIAGGYTIYTVPSGLTNPSIVCPKNDGELIYWATALGGGQNIYSAGNALGYITSGLTNSMVVNMNYPSMQTYLQTHQIDASFTASYPRTGNKIYSISNYAATTNGDVINSPSFTGSSVGGSIRLLSDNSQYINLGNIFRYDSIAFSFSMWVYFTTLTTNVAGQGPTLFYKGSTSVDGYYCQVSTGGTISFVTNQAGANQVTSTSASTVTTSSWYNITITREGSGVNIYVNGVDVTSVAGTHINPTLNNSDFRIGSYPSVYSNILISQFTAWISTKLTPTQVLSNYNAFVDRYTPIYIGGAFSRVGTNPIQNLYAFNPYGETSPTTNFGVGLNSTGTMVKTDFNGKLVVAGYFDTYNGANSAFIVRLNPDGTKDTTFSTGNLNGAVNDFAIDSNNRLILVGYFNTVSGSSYNGIIRLNYNGTIDTSFRVGTGFDNVPNSVFIGSDTKIYVGGLFSSYSGISANLIVRLNADGSHDSSFSAGTGSSIFGVFDTINQVLLASNSKIYAFGDLSTYSGQSCGNVISFNYDGSINSNFNKGSGFNNIVNKAALDSNGKIIAVGYFTSYSGITSNRIIKLNSDGSLDSTFSAGTGFNQFTTGLYVSSQNSVYVGGNFTTYQGTTSNGLILLNSGGTINNSFNIGNGFVTNNGINGITLLNNNTVVINGSFSDYGGTSSLKFSGLNTDGTGDTSFLQGSGFNNDVYAIAKTTTKKIFVGGNFTDFQSLGVTSYIARVTQNGNYDSAPSADRPVWALTVDSNNKIYVGGEFTFFGGNSQLRIIRLNDDGTKDTNFVNGTGCNSTVYKIHIDSSNKIIIGGDFTTYKGATATRVKRIDSVGTADATFTATSNSTVYAIGTDSSNNVILGGNFTSINSVTNNRIVKLNSLGAILSSFSAGTGFNGIVYSVVIDSNDKIIVAGDFTTYSGAACNRIVRLNTNGTIDSTFSTGTGLNAVARSLLLTTGDKVYVGGNFTTYNGTTVYRVMKLNSDGTIDTSFNSGYGPNSTVYTIVK